MQSIGAASSQDKSVFVPKLTRQIAVERKHHHSVLQMGWKREVAQGHAENLLVELRSVPRPHESQLSPINGSTTHNQKESQYSK